MNPLAEEPTPSECLAVAQWGLLGLIWSGVHAAWKRRQLERRIHRAYVQFVAATTPETQLQFFALMRELIAERTPLQVKRMERERGLRAS